MCVRAVRLCGRREEKSKKMARGELLVEPAG
jgi:hypothetical protein